ncbi:MAG: vitamin K epoxide reductase family protein [Acidimicrobiia bacterium]
MRTRASFLFVLVAMLFAIALPASAQSDTNEDAAIRMVFFFSPTCGHCEYVINEVLPGVFEQYGGEPSVFFDENLPPEAVAFYEMTNGTLDILFADVLVDDGADLYESDSERLGIPDDRMGVPRLVVMDDYYVGSAEIPEELPGIIEAGLEAGGIPWPDIPGIEDALATVPGLADGNQPVVDQPTPGDESATEPSATENEAAALPSAEDQSIADRFGNDPAGNSLAVLVLVAMIASLVAVPIMIGKGLLGSAPVWLVPVFAIVGIGVSIYLGSVEASGADAICGPVGDCNAVQQSEYASIFGVPIGILGVVGYGVLLAGWVASRVAKGTLADLGLIVAGAIAFGGTLFSIYLTFLEPFVIGATCMWCLTSAVAITGLLWLTAGPASEAFGRLRSS